METKPRDGVRETAAANRRNVIFFSDVSRQMNQQASRVEMFIGAKRRVSRTMTLSKGQRKERATSIGRLRSTLGDRP